VHTEGDLPRCKYEYDELVESGYYARGDEWLEHLHRADPETWCRLIEEKRIQEEVSREIESGRWFGERPGEGYGDTEPEELSEPDDGDTGTRNEEEAKEGDSDDKRGSAEEPRRVEEDDDAEDEYEEEDEEDDEPDDW
jgi:hypothetical protein